jgi:hypothetical protein
MSRQRLGTQQPTVIQKEPGAEASLMPDSEMLLTVWNGDLEPSQYYGEEKALLKIKIFAIGLLRNFNFSRLTALALKLQGSNREYSVRTEEK